MAIQNINRATAAQVSVSYATTPDPTVVSFNIPAGGVHYIRHADEGRLPSPFFGAATVTANQDVGVVVTPGSSDGSLLSVYPTYSPSAGAGLVYLPGAYKNILSMGYYLYWSSCTIVNMGASAVTVHIEYSALSGTVNPAGRNVGVGANSSLTIDQRSDPLITSDTFFGAIKLSVVGSGSIAAMLNVRGDAPSGAAVHTTTYSGFSSGSTVAFTPYLLKYVVSGGYTWSTSILIENLDQSSPLTVNITYKSGGSTYTSQKANITSFDYVDLRNEAMLPTPFYGSGKLTSVGDHPFGIVVLVRGSNVSGTGDAFSSYLGVTQ